MLEGVTLEQAVECICQRVHKYEKIRKIAVSEAGGCCLAEDIYAGMDNPPFPALR